MSERFSDVHRRYVIEGDPVRSAEAIASDLKLNASQRDALLPLIIGECERLDRVTVRTVERAVGRAVGQPGRRVDPAAARSAMLASTFSLGKGERIPWGEATVAQHLARIDYLAKIRDGIDRTIEIHRLAATRISEAGVSCLNELDEPFAIPADLPSDEAIKAGVAA